MALLEHEDYACVVLYEEAFGMSCNYLSLDLVFLINRFADDVCDGRDRSLDYFAEFDELAAFAFGKEYVIESVGAEALGCELDIECLGACRQGEVSCCESPLTCPVIFHSTEIIIERRCPYVAVLGEEYLEIGFDEGVGSSL